MEAEFEVKKRSMRELSCLRAEHQSESVTR